MFRSAVVTSHVPGFLVDTTGFFGYIDENIGNEAMFRTLRDKDGTPGSIAFCVSGPRSRLSHIKFTPERDVEAMEILAAQQAVWDLRIAQNKAADDAKPYVDSSGEIIYHPFLDKDGNPIPWTKGEYRALLCKKVARRYLLTPEEAAEASAKYAIVAVQAIERTP